MNVYGAPSVFDWYRARRRALFWRRVGWTLMLAAAMFAVGVVWP